MIHPTHKLLIINTEIEKLKKRIWSKTLFNSNCNHCRGMIRNSWLKEFHICLIKLLHPAQIAHNSINFYSYMRTPFSLIIPNIETPYMIDMHALNIRETSTKLLLICIKPFPTQLLFRPSIL
jgi:hypothetical protein